METTRTVEEFVAEATRDARSVQEALRRYAEECASTARACLAAGAAVQQASLSGAFELESATVQASRAMLAATSQANQSVVEQWAKGAQDYQKATIGLASAAGRLFEVFLPAAKR